MKKGPAAPKRHTSLMRLAGRVRIEPATNGLSVQGTCPPASRKPRQRTGGAITGLPRSATAMHDDGLRALDRLEGGAPRRRDEQMVRSALIRREWDAYAIRIARAQVGDALEIERLS